MTLFGWDASDFDWDRGPMDLGAARRDGVVFFTHKATENTNVKHLHFGEAMARARDAGVPFLGAYHVVRSPRNAQQELDYFLSYVDRAAPWLWKHDGSFIQVDLEKWPYDAVPAAEGEAFADLAEAQVGKVAVIYASKGQYGNELAGTSHELWNANYPLSYQTGTLRELYNRAGGDSGPGWATYSGRTPKIWQYTSSARIGSQNTCDANAFRGSEEDFRAMIQGDDVALTPEEHGWLRLIAFVTQGTNVGMKEFGGERIYNVDRLLAHGEFMDLTNKTLGQLGQTVADLSAKVGLISEAIKAGNGSPEVAALVAKMDAETEELKAFYEARRQEDRAVAEKQHGARIAALEAELAALRQQAGQ